jgi:DNA-binding transcriptional ArsR family regulator
MQTEHEQFAALGNELRLSVFRYVIAAGAEGRSAGDIARHHDVPPSTMSSHLKTLEHSGLLRRHRVQQSQLYCVDSDAVRHLVGFLVNDCCQGQPDLCGIEVA